MCFNKHFNDNKHKNLRQRLGNFYFYISACGKKMSCNKSFWPEEGERGPCQTFKNRREPELFYFCIILCYGVQSEGLYGRDRPFMYLSLLFCVSQLINQNKAPPPVSKTKDCAIDFYTLHQMPHWKSKEKLMFIHPQLKIDANIKHLFQINLKKTAMPTFLFF